MNRSPSSSPTSPVASPGGPPDPSPTSSPGRLRPAVQAGILLLGLGMAGGVAVPGHGAPPPAPPGADTFPSPPSAEPAAADTISRLRPCICHEGDSTVAPRVRILAPGGWDGMLADTVRWEALERVQSRLPGELREWMEGWNTPDIRPRLGVSVRDAEDGSVQVEEVTPRSGAARAGIRRGDRILAVDGAPVADADGLIAALEGKAEGDTVQVRLRRGTEEAPGQAGAGEEEVVAVELQRLAAWGMLGQDPLLGRVQGWGPGAAPGEGARIQRLRVAPPRPGAPPLVSARFPGTGGLPWVELADLNEGLGSYFGRSRGALVLETGPAAPVGIRPGDILVQVDGREVGNRADARRILASYRSGESATLLLWREGAEVAVEITVP
jgi:membrane-associated protease RseP (regulator of RpoE activity)